MPQVPQRSAVEGNTPGCASKANITSPSAAQPLVFGSWLPEDFDSLSFISPNPDPLVTTSNAPAASGCALQGEPALSCGAALDGMDAPGGPPAYTSAQHAPAPPPGISALHGQLHLLMSANCGSMLQQQHQLAPAPAQPLFLVPTALSMFTPQLIHFFGGVPGMVAANAAPLSAWGVHHGANNFASSPYHGVSYPGSTGFWLNGLYFPSYEHFNAYRRRIIAYNFHYFGIRPFFRPPPGLPRPRPPVLVKLSGTAPRTAAASAPVAAPLAAGASAGGGGSAPVLASRAGKAYDDNDSPCCSPGSTSTCSNGDSDDAASDVCQADPDVDLLCDPQPMAGVSLPNPNLDSAVSAAAAATKAGHAQHLYGGLSRGQHHLGASDADGASAAAAATAGAAAASLVVGAGVCVRAAYTGEEKLLASCGSGGGECAVVAALSRSLSPVRCNYAGGGGYDACEEVRDEVRSAGCYGVSSHGGAGGSPMAGVCPQWLECQFCVLLDRVVGDALLGREDAA